MISSLVLTASPSVLADLDRLVVAALWTATALRIPIALRQPRSLIWLLAILVEALSMTVNEPLIGAALDQFTRVPFLETLAKHVLFLAFEALIFLVVNVAIGYKARRNQRAIVGYTIVTALAMTVLFFFANNTVGPHFLPYRVTLSPLTLYWFAYLSYVAIDSTMAFLLFWRASRKAESGILRVSFGFLAVGFAAGLGYATIYIALILGKPLYSSMALIMYGGLLCFVVGSSLATIPDYLAMAWSYQSRLRLYPLWRDLQSVTPGIALTGPQGIFHEISTVSLQHRLYRRIIEIHDGLLALRKHIPHDLPHRAQQFVLLNSDAVNDIELTATACVLEVARRAKARGDALPDTIAPVPFFMAEVGEFNLVAEASALIQLANAHRSPIVREFANTAHTTDVK